MLVEMLSTVLPISIVTAIVSPNARPRPSRLAPAIPGAERFSTAMRSISQRVAPSASAASFSPTGATAKTSRQMAVMIGSTMIARMMPAAKYDGPKNGPLKTQPTTGIGLSQLERLSAIGCRTGRRAKMPQKP